MTWFRKLARQIWHDRLLFVNGILVCKFHLGLARSERVRNSFLGSVALIDFVNLFLTENGEINAKLLVQNGAENLKYVARYHSIKVIP